MHRRQELRDTGFEFAPVPSATTFVTGRPAPPMPLIPSVKPSITLRVSVLPAGPEATMHFTTPPFGSASRKTSNSRLRGDVGDVLQFQAESRVGPVDAVASHRLVVGHVRQRAREFVRSGRLEDRGASAPSIMSIMSSTWTKLISRSSWVNSGWRSARRSSSRKQRTIWHVLVEAAHHEELLEELRPLRQRVEVAGLTRGGHEEVARAFGRALGEEGRFEFEEAVGVEVVA